MRCTTRYSGLSASRARKETHEETYLGDGVYATYANDGTIWLDVRGQGSPTIGPAGVPSIALESHVWEALTNFIEGVKGDQL